MSMLLHKKYCFVSPFKVFYLLRGYCLVLPSPNGKYSSLIYLLYYSYISFLKQTVLEKIRKKI